VTVGIVASLLVAQILPSIVIANSLFVVYHKLHLLNSYPGLILADASYAVPFSILVMRAFMLGLPTDVLQAARVDGATEWGTFVRIVLPMSRSAIITVGVLCAVIGFVIRGRALAVQFRRGDRQAAELARAAKALRESESRFRAVIGFGKPDPTIALRSSPATAPSRCSRPSLNP